MIELLQRLGYAPRYCVWELTLVCNMKCLHCGSYAGASRERELSYEDCLSVADQLADMKCERVTLGGGEPTLHPHWDELGKRLGDRGVRVNVLSNGWTWSEEHLRRAQDAGLRNVAFSLDGLEQVHDQVRREGSFQRVVAAIEGCVAAEMPVSAVTHINQLNLHTLPQMHALLAELGVGWWQLQLGIPSGHLSGNRELVIAPEELLWLIPQIAEMRSDGAAPEVCPADNIGYFGKHEKELRDRGATINFWIGCRAGCQVIGIESNGNIKGCLSLPSARHDKGDLFVEGSLREESLETIWRDEDRFALNRAFREDMLDGFCAVCRFRDICRGGCAWTAYSHTRNRFDNPYCFYRQAVAHRRFDLLDDEPNEAELAATEPAD